MQVNVQAHAEAEKKATIHSNHTSCVRMLTKYESDLHSVHKRMHGFTQ